MTHNGETIKQGDPQMVRLQWRPDTRDIWQYYGWLKSYALDINVLFNEENKFTIAENHTYKKNKQ